MNIIITGHSSGFRKEMALVLAKNGRRVYATMRSLDGNNSAQAQALLKEVEILNDQIIPVDQEAFMQSLGCEAMMYVSE